MPKMNINEVSELLTINPETLRKWDKQFNLNVGRNKKGHRNYSQDDINRLIAIKQLRDLDNGIETINRKLNPSWIQDDNKNNPDEPGFMVHNNQEVISKLDLLVIKLDTITDLSEKYARASYEIGSLKATLEAEQQKNKLIVDSSGKDVASLQKEIEKQRLDFESQVEKFRLDNEALKAKFEAEQKRAWYKKLFK
jgi:DNA-binding transcriptional MerR regulator